MKPHHGILDLSFPLASEAALGTYTIKLEGISFDKKKETEKTFTVEEYGIISIRCQDKNQTSEHYNIYNTPWYSSFILLFISFKD